MDIYVIKWTSEFCGDENGSGVSKKAFKSEEECREYRKEVLDKKKISWLADGIVDDEDEVEIDYERGTMHDCGHSNCFYAAIKKLELDLD